jgi:hypothetical protein
MDSLEIEFDEDAHAYSLDGVRVPALTHILSEMGAAPNFRFLPAEDLRFYQERGKAVHRAVELTLRGSLDKRTLDHNVRPYMKSIERFLADYPIEVLQLDGEPFVERRLIHPVFRFGCTPDIVGRLHGQSGVIEVKSTSQHSAATQLQTAAQLLAVRHYLPKIEGLRMGLRLIPKEPYYDMKIYDERSDEAVWLSLLNSYNWLTKHKLLRTNGGR